jgi:hypothetical protein
VPSNAPSTVAVLGSCITRDSFNSVFNPTYKLHYACPVHQDQTSLVSLMSEPLEVDWQPTREMSDYDRRYVETEFSKSFLTEVAEAQPDYLVVDFFADIHFGVLQVDGGPYVTDNRWKVRPTTWYEQMQAAGRLRRIKIVQETEAYLGLWEEALDRFLAWFGRTLPDTTLIVHRGHNTNRLRLPDRPEPVNLRKNRKIARLNVKRANQLWAQLDRMVVERTGCEVIDVLDREYVTYPEHPWGAFYVHYEPLYYHRFLAELHKIHLARSLGEAGAAMLAEVVAVQEELAAETVADLLRRNKLLRRRVEELEAAEARRLGRRLRRRMSRGQDS